MKKEDALREQEEFFIRRFKSGRDYWVTGIDSIHCLDDLLFWKYTDRAWWRYQLQCCQWLGEMLLSFKFTASEMRLFYWMGDKVVYNNVCYFSGEDAMRECGVKATQFREFLNNLEEKGLIKVGKVPLSDRKDRVVAVTPAAFWKGEYIAREAYITSWYPRVGDNSWMLRGLE